MFTFTCPAPLPVPRMGQDGRASDFSGSCLLVHRSLHAFSFLICTEPVPAAQFVFWLIKLGQTPWLISTKEGVENTLCLLAQNTSFSFLQPSLSRLPFQPPPSLPAPFFPFYPLHQEVIAKAAAVSCPPGWHCSTPGTSPVPAPQNASQQDTDPGNRHFSPAVLFCCDSSWERHGISSTEMDFRPNFIPPPPTKQTKNPNKDRTTCTDFGGIRGHLGSPTCI